MTQTALRVTIHGRVQGVGYRAWTARRARELGLRGWVQNRRDGTVEAAFFGEAEAVRTMVERCRSGPPAARVDAVDEAPEAGTPPAGFDQLPTV